MIHPDLPDTITCVECSGQAHRMTHPPPDEGFLRGDVVTYVCEDCGRRFDIVYEEPDEDPPGF